MFVPEGKCCCPPPCRPVEITGQSAGGEPPATLTVTVTGTGPVTYQWYEGESGDTSNPIIGATTDEYVAEDAGSYWVRVTNPCGTDDSDTAVVTGNPLVGTDWYYWDASEGPVYSDYAGMVPIAGTEGDSVQNIPMAGPGALLTRSRNLFANRTLYGTAAGPRAINGLPVLYGPADASAYGFYAAGAADAQASAFLAGGTSGAMIALLRKRTTNNNVPVFLFGSNAPVAVRQYSAPSNQMRAYGFYGGNYKEISAAMSLGVHVLCVRFSATLLEIRVDNGAWQQVAVDPWTPDAGPMLMYENETDVQCLGFRATALGNAEADAVIAALMARGGI